MIKHANIRLDIAGTPRSEDYGDVYFSSDDGIAESTYVFLHHNQLRQRFEGLAPGSTFVIAETGFGTGLNFLLTWQLFMQAAPSDAHLYFISCEKHPLTAEDLQNIHMQIPSLMPLSSELHKHYPIPLQGFHCLNFNRVTLQLLYSDAGVAFSQLQATVDAWFLDGFAPAKNPDMWSPLLFSEMSRLSHSKTTVATFSAAKIVREGLSGAGFKINKMPGFGRKRDMLCGTYVGIQGPLPQTGWPSSPLSNPVASPGHRISIIGSGIAGAHTARAFAEAGYKVTLYDQASEPAQGGSGNIQGAIYAKLSASPNIATQFYSHALLTAQKWLSNLPERAAHHACGLAQLVHDQRELKRLNDLAISDYIPDELAQVLSAEALSDLTGINVTMPGLWFPNGGWVSPPQAVTYLLEHENIQCHFEHRLVDLKKQDNSWQLDFDNGITVTAEQLVLCNGYDVGRLKQTSHLPLNAIAGQVTQLASDSKTNTLQAVICTDRYVMPALNQQITIGSTFRLKSTETHTLSSEDDENIESLKQRLPGFLPESPVRVGHRAGVRCTTPDYLPIVGPIAEPNEFLAQFTLPIQRNRSHRTAPANYLTGLWVNTGHGSKGLCSTPICAQLLVAMVTGKPYPLPQPIVDALNPNRFLVRQILRAKRTPSKR